MKFLILPPLRQIEIFKQPSKEKVIGNVWTLVLDLDETFIHYEINETVDTNIEDPGYYLIRPGALLELFNLLG